MRIPFIDLISPVGRPRAIKPEPSNIAYLELYMAINNCKDLAEDQVFELQGLLEEKLKSRRELQRSPLMAD